MDRNAYRDLDQLEGRTRAIAFTLCPRHIGVVKLPLEPTRRGKRALARGLDANAQRPLAHDVVPQLPVEPRRHQVEAPEHQRDDAQREVAPADGQQRAVALDGTVKALPYALQANGMTVAALGLVQGEGAVMLFACEDAFVERGAVTEDDCGIVEGMPFLRRRKS